MWLVVFASGLWSESQWKCVPLLAKRIYGGFWENMQSDKAGYIQHQYVSTLH